MLQAVHSLFGSFAHSIDEGLTPVDPAELASPEPTPRQGPPPTRSRPSMLSHCEDSSEEEDSEEEDSEEEASEEELAPEEGSSPSGRGGDFRARPTSAMNKLVDHIFWRPGSPSHQRRGRVVPWTG